MGTLKWRYLILLALAVLIFPVCMACVPKTPETVVFPDKNLEKVVRTALDKPAGEAITPAELAELTMLSAREQGITDLSAIEYCTNLTRLELSKNQLRDVSPLSSLTNLTMLQLNNISSYSIQIDDISPLSSLTNLTYLSLRSNEISDISPLASLTNLQWVSLYNNQISDISPLVENSGLGEGDRVLLGWNNLDLSEGSEDLENIRILEERGVRVDY
ncbi:hypothetical protein ES704_04056 [subsurface metagenome]|jgi:hypothetical protein